MEPLKDTIKKLGKKVSTLEQTMTTLKKQSSKVLHGTNSIDLLSSKFTLGFHRDDNEFAPVFPLLINNFI